MDFKKVDKWVQKMICAENVGKVIYDDNRAYYVYKGNDGKFRASHVNPYLVDQMISFHNNAVGMSAEVGKMQESNQQLAKKCAEQEQEITAMRKQLERPVPTITEPVPLPHRLSVPDLKELKSTYDTDEIVKLKENGII